MVLRVTRQEGIAAETGKGNRAWEIRLDLQAKGGHIMLGKLSSKAMSVAPANHRVGAKIVPIAHFALKLLRKLMLHGPSDVLKPHPDLTLVCF
jgi:hypothetical protein